MRVQVLVASMHQKDTSLIETMNLSVSTVLVNQCDCDAESVNIFGNVTMINSPERGLSRSRNLAIKNCSADVAIVSDDDEEFIDDLENLVVKAYEELPKADLIIFDIHGRDRKFGDTPRKLKKLELLKVSSVRVSFRVDKIKDNVWFDENLGAGTGNGAGEENKFLFDCHKKGLKIYHYPLYIATLVDEESSWFVGFDKQYFYNRGMVTRYVMGWFWSTLYAFYYSFAKRKLHKGQMSMFKSLKYTLQGIRQNKLKRKNKG